MSTFWRWALAVVITLGTLVWQRMTGPTYPARGVVKLGDQAISMKLGRSNSTASDQPVSVRVADSGVTGEVVWRRYPSSEPWQVLELKREGADAARVAAQAAGRRQAGVPGAPLAGWATGRVPRAAGRHALSRGPADSRADPPHRGDVRRDAVRDTCRDRSAGPAARPAAARLDDARAVPRRGLRLWVRSCSTTPSGSGGPGFRSAGTSPTTRPWLPPLRGRSRSTACAAGGQRAARRLPRR